MNPVRALLLRSKDGEQLCLDLETILLKQFPNQSSITIERVEGVVFSRTFCETFSAGSDAEPDIVFLVVTEANLAEAAELVLKIKQSCLRSSLIIVTDCRDPAEVFGLLRTGASDFVTAPLRAVDIVARVKRLVDRTSKLDEPTNSLRERLGLRHLVGQCPEFVALINQFPVLARCDASVLITGETGTGKELCARAIHYLSPRSGRAFVPVNCGAIPSELVENELFGHEREAFTGASSSRTGLVQESDRGTLFLDEIDCLPLLAQVKLLRFLQDGEYRPLGSSRTRRGDVRVIAASNADLEEAVQSGRVRRDFYYRLNVIQLALPPLRERREDILLLAAHFLDKYAARFNKRVTGYSTNATQKLIGYDWPGNVRELEHVVERAVVLTERETVARACICLPGKASAGPIESFRERKANIIAQFERNYIQTLLRAHQGNITRAAEAARKDRRALRHLIRKHNINVRAYRDNAD